MPWQSELWVVHESHKSFIFGMKEENTLETKSKASFRRIGREYKEADVWVCVWGVVIMVHFNLPSVRGFAMSTVPTPAHHWGNHIRSGSPILCGFNPTKRKSHSDFPQYCNGCEGRDKCAFTESMAKNMHFRAVTSSETLKHFDIAWFHKLPGEVSWCLVGYDATHKVLCLSKLGEKNKTWFNTSNIWRNASPLKFQQHLFFFFLHSRLPSENNLDVLFVPACLPALWCQNCEMWYFCVCLCLLHVKGQWWRDDSTTTQYHHVVPPNRAEAWRRIHCQPGGLERPRQEPACYCNRYHTYASH